MGTAAFFATVGQIAVALIGFAGLLTAFRSRAPRSAAGAAPLPLAERYGAGLVGLLLIATLRFMGQILSLLDAAEKTARAE